MVNSEYRCLIKRIMTVFLCAVLVLNISALFREHDASASSSKKYTAEEYADILLKKMSTDNKAAQLMLVRAQGKDSLKLQKKYQFGGYILFAADFAGSDPEKLRKRIAKWQSRSKTKMLIAVDEEGGTVVRASLYRSFRSSRFKSPRAVYKSKGWDGIVSYTKAKDKFLKNLGINTNLAPVADVTYSSKNFMYSRAFSESASKTSKFIRLSVDRMNKDKVVSALKHFPGYGAGGDTHTKLIRDKRSLSALKKRDLKPFAAGISHGADMIMVSHVIVNAFDSKRPASMSKAVHKYLRNNMGYKGVIVTDSLNMQGVVKYAGGDSGETAVKAILAGNDMVIVDSSPEKVYKSIRAAVRKGRINSKKLDDSVRRILIMKIKKGIISY